MPHKHFNVARLLAYFVGFLAWGLESVRAEMRAYRDKSSDPR